MKNRSSKKKPVVEPTNPFDVRINRQKHKVLGRRVMKWEVGKPLQSRHAGIKKRKETLLPELRNLHKSGKGVIDQRAAVTSRKAKLYQDVDINDKKGVNLTHKGEELDDERLNQPLKDDDDDEEEFDLLRRGDYVEVAHFGGGESGAPLSSEDFLQQVMVDKRQKQLEKEENIKLTEELDKNWSTIRNLIKHKGSKDESSMGQAEDYDIFLNQLMFGGDDQKATVVAAPKTEPTPEQEKTISPNELIMGYLHNIMTVDDVDTILKEIDNLLSIEIKRLNSTVVKKAFNLLKAKEMKLCTLKSLGVLMFLLTFVELKQQVILKLINFLRILRYDSIEDVSKRLLVCSVLYSAFPNQFFPEIIASLQNTLILFEPVYASMFIPTFSFERIASSEILCWSETMDFDDLPAFDFQSVFKGTISASDKNKSIVFTALIELIKTVHRKYSAFDASQPMFARMLPILINLQEKFPEPISSQLNNLIDDLNASKTLQTLAFERKKPPMLKMLEPRVGDFKRKDDRKKMQRVVKREYKSAARELRKDGAFVRDIVLKDTIAKDEARKRKVKKLMSEIAQERAMFKKAR